MLKLLNLKTSKTEQGFTMFEVLVAMLIVMGFILAAMQGSVIATVFMVKAQRTEKANLLIQENIETIKNLAASFAQDDTLCSASSSTTGYAQALGASIPALDYDDDGTSGNDSDDDVDNSDSDTNDDRKLLAKTYQLQRTLTPSSTAPHTSLRVSYSVVESGGTDVIATDYIEVIPNAAFECP